MCSLVDDSGGRVAVQSVNALSDCVEDSELAGRPVGLVNLEEIEPKMAYICGGAKLFHVDTLSECNETTNAKRYGNVCEVYESDSVDQVLE
jgi:hypothetical protein